jgi:hypothetical protein
MRKIRLAIGAGLLAALVWAPAMAGDYSDRVHADSFGNLVIHSHAGHKRILVGMGHVAESYNLTGSYYQPEEPQVVYLDGERDTRQVRRCSRPPHVWHGRAHMYGLPEGVVPQAPLVCR